MKTATDVILKRKEIEERLAHWYAAWAEYDLDGVLSLFHEQVRYRHWDGRVLIGRSLLRLVWSSWFARRDFRFDEEETFIDEHAQKALYRWRLTRSLPPHSGVTEEQSGVDVLHFHGGLITAKLTYSGTEETDKQPQ